MTTAIRTIPGTKVRHAAEVTGAEADRGAAVVAGAKARGIAVGREVRHAEISGARVARDRIVVVQAVLDPITVVQAVPDRIAADREDLGPITVVQVAPGRIIVPRAALDLTIVVPVDPGLTTVVPVARAQTIVDRVDRVRRDRAGKAVVREAAAVIADRVISIAPVPVVTVIVAIAEIVVARRLRARVR